MTADNFSTKTIFITEPIISREICITFPMELFYSESFAAKIIVIYSYFIINNTHIVLSYLS